MGYESLYEQRSKAPSFNIYDICYAETQREQKDYIAYIDAATLRRYDAVDINVYELPPKTCLEITNNLRKEMIEIFSGRNIF